MERKNNSKVAALNDKTNKIQISIPRATRTVKPVKVSPTVLRDNASLQQSNKKPKEPKFVPYEPYKAATKPILSSEIKKPKAQADVAPTANQCTKKLELPKPNKVRNFECSNVAKVSPVVLPKLNVVPVEKEKPLVDATDVAQIKKELEASQRENCSLKEQLLRQTKVNTELKKLLVASVGDDLETKLQFLTQDKISLAHDVHHYVQRLLADHEELEKLSIQCDVWRSKFLASSLIIDELAKWKAIVYHHYDDALSTIQILLDEHAKLSDHLKITARNLMDIEEEYNSSATTPHPGAKTVLEMAESVSKISSRLQKRFTNPKSHSAISLHDQMPTAGETRAKQVLHASYCDLSLDCVELLNPATSSLRSGVVHRFHPNTRFEHLTMNCCSNCQGDIHLL